MKAIVTGGAGFIGCHVARYLLQQGHHVLVLDDLSGGFESNIPSQADFECRSVTGDLEALFGQFKPESIYHFAAYAAEGLTHHIPVFNYSNNLTGTANVLAAGYRAGVSHFVFTSSIAVYGHGPHCATFQERDQCVPCDPYGVAKLACENHIRVFHDYYGRPNYTIFRPHNVFGPRQNISDPYRNVVGIFMKNALTRNPLPIFGDGSQTRSFSYISEIAQCLADAPFVAAARNKVFNLGSDERMSIRDLAGHICRIFGAKEELKFLPPRQEVINAHADHSLVRSAFPELFEAQTSVTDGLRMTADFVRSNPVPEITECPSRIEISDQLPVSWRAKP